MREGEGAKVMRDVFCWNRGHLRGACISIDWVVARHHNGLESCENIICCIYSCIECTTLFSHSSIPAFSS